MAERTSSTVGGELILSSMFGNRPGFDANWLLSRILDSVEEVSVREGDVLVREGDPCEFMFFMADGRLRLSREGLADFIYEGRWAIGTNDVIIGRPYRRTITALREGPIVRTPARGYLEVVEESFDLASSALVGSVRTTFAVLERLAPDAPFGGCALRTPQLDTTSLVGRALLLTHVPLLSGGTVQALTDLAGVSATHSLEEGEVLFSPERPENRLFVVAEGAIELSRAGSPTRGVFGRGNAVGGALWLVAREGGWTARATERTRLVSFSVDDWWNQMEEHPELARGALSAIAQEREALQEALAERLGELVLR